MTFKPGKPKSGGRQAGTPNKMTAQIHEAIVNAFNKVGGVDFLVWLAENKPEVFAGLLKALIPKNVNLGSQEDNKLEIIIKGYNDKN